jgi:hypothetical protein
MSSQKQLGRVFDYHTSYAAERRMERDITEDEQRRIFWLKFMLKELVLYLLSFQVPAARTDI